MNWYKELKFASPIINDPVIFDTYRRERYSKDLHEGYFDREEIAKPIIVFFIDEDYNLHQTQSTSNEGHVDWDEYGNFSQKKMLAGGRYSPETKSATVLIHQRIRDNPHIYMYVRKRVGKILDMAFDNPDIREGN